MSVAMRMASAMFLLAGVGVITAFAAFLATVWDANEWYTKRIAVTGIVSFVFFMVAGGAFVGIDKEGEKR